MIPTGGTPRTSGRAPDGAPGQGVRPPSAGGRRPQRANAGGAGSAGGRGAYGGNGGNRGAAVPAPVRPARRRRFPVKTVVLLVVLAVIAYPLALLAVAWTHLGRVDALPADTAATPGRTYLVVGSDSRKGLTKEQAKQLHTGGGDVGQRTDTIMLLHVPAGGGPTVIMSIPRDSYVAIPGHGHNKINAAFAFGGPKLLARTIEQATGVQIDDYAEIGFGGFAAMVDAVGGVQICPKRDMKDKDAGLNIKKGCQQANGPVALGYARARHSDPRGDLGRVERQREVLAAIVAKATRPSTLVNPFRTFPLASSGAGALTVDEHTGPVALVRFILGMKGAAGGNGLSMTVPVAGTGTRAGAGSVVLWDDAKARKVFAALKRSDTEALRPYAEEQKAQRSK
ncbi:MAG: LCP family protein [Angustibacter sp.]